VDRERPLAGGAAARDDRVRAAYGARAAEYADRLVDELDDPPFERWLLDRVVAAAGSRPVVDAGCGPGHVTAYLAGAGADAVGIDLTPEMIEQAGAVTRRGGTTSAT
jgi:SAM-dependent methyltransferase